MNFTEQQYIEIENALEHLEALIEERIEEQGWAHFPEALEDTRHAEFLDDAQVEEVHKLFKAKEEKGRYKFLSSWQQITK